MAENHAMNLNRNKHRLVTIQYLHRRGGFFQFYVFWPIRSKLAAEKLRAHLFSGLRSLSPSEEGRGKERRAGQSSTALTHRKAQPNGGDAGGDAGRQGAGCWVPVGGITRDARRSRFPHKAGKSAAIGTQRATLGNKKIIKKSKTKERGARRQNPTTNAPGGGGLQLAMLGC